ncbi:ATP-binding protein [Flavobacterium sp.]|uniref:sensor histidine kinase n=1 Tax=Flavobacterium sp. TaxID=239 RepID=UPI001217EFDE|nr:ATP-binding protein [Flavobacterium sp.]RZJ71233.1 MAG: sensor histidine kinase [Flavobacterium sp.]
MEKDTQISSSNETLRMQALREYDILDTLGEQDYDDITEMASVICEVPIALISLVDESRQWFKSRKGLAIDQTPREYSFCSRAILKLDEALIVEDSRKDERFMHNPYVLGDPNIVFYAGIPLVSQSGMGLGTVCVIDNKPRVLTEKQIAALKILSRQVMKLLELRKSNLQLLDAREALETINNGLEDTINRMVDQRVGEIAAQNEHLERMNKELQSFAYISSHDLQEPLRKIQTFMSWISEKESHLLSEKGRDYLQKTHLASDRMRNLIQDLLAYSRTTASEIVFEKRSLQHIVNEVCEDLMEEFEQKKALIHLDSDAEITVIPFQFRQMLYNLFSNALKFTKFDISPIINISVSDVLHADGANYHKISVSDNGIGFDNDYNKKIFELFHQLHSKRGENGTGIGLAIVSKIADNHKGFVEAHSKKDEGATFHVYVPVA